MCVPIAQMRHELIVHRLHYHLQLLVHLRYANLESLQLLVPMMINHGFFDLYASSGPI